MFSTHRIQPEPFYDIVDGRRVIITPPNTDDEPRLYQHSFVVGCAGVGRSIYNHLAREIRIEADPSKPLPLAGTIYDPRRYRRP